MPTPLRVVPLAKERVWGGSRLAPPGNLPIGELWLAGPWNEIAGGEHAGHTLEGAARALGPALVGTAAPKGGGPRFPLLVKLLDPAQWLSVQVHPDDDVARRLEGLDAVGKTEAWYVVGADPGAALLVGVRPGVTLDTVRAAIALAPEHRGSAVVDLMRRISVRPGDAILVRAGMLHSVGPGCLVYELQQPSDITYRVDDWGRAPTPARPLHQEQALASVAVEPVEMSAAGDEGRRLRPLLACAHFALDRVDEPAELDPDGRSLHVVTALGGPVELSGDGWTAALDTHDTAVVPASSGPYRLDPGPGARALVARLA